MPTVFSSKDLGIIISDKITLENHIQNKLVAARKTYEFLKRKVTYTVSSSTKLMYYCLCIQSILQYGSQLWYPSINCRRKLELFNKECFFLGFWVTKLFTATGSIKYTTRILLFGSLRHDFPQQGHTQQI